MAAVIIPGNTPPPKVDIVRAPKEYVAPVVDTRVTNYNSLSTFAAGSRWACDFYLQITSGDTAPQAYAHDQLFIYSQSRLIRGFELVVTSPLNIQQGDGVERGFSVTGSANVYSVITPNEGNVFVADIGDGRNGVFTVTKVSRPTHYAESFTTIDFKQIQILNEDLEKRLNDSVVETLFFNREMLRSGLFPLIKSSQVDTNRRLIAAYRRLTNLYVHEFLNVRYNTFMLPGQDLPTYDPYMTHFVLRVLDRAVCTRLGDAIELTATHNHYSRVQTLLNAIEALDDGLLYSVGSKASVASRLDWRMHPLFSTIFNSGVSRVVVITDSPYLEGLDRTKMVPVGDIVDAGFKKTDIDSLLPAVGGGAAPVGLIHPVTKDDYYIFSEAFYKDIEGQSHLENIVRKRLAQEPYDTKLLADIAEYADEMPNLERFYYIPIILAMIKVTPGVL